MFKQLDGKTLVSGQITADDLSNAKAQGVTLVVNNRPDAEDPGQPTSDEIEAAAHAAGMDYCHIPIVRGMGPSDVELMRGAMARAGDGKLLAFCRSGMRSTLAWAVASREEGVPRDQLEKGAAAAGFSLAAVDHLL
ncbi:TIGR01244 family sulfur transferase [Sphingomonas sp. BN140010]|uniref:TIGR01244 family sulfur transferase n=1 Tax=Sphingomonas arvum TaxID=2992113 RepID=A0ABT3JFF2_9SPHN|nr:TIGR01244 family sulfur transferase [Sphingomonas sp. BN140010]MCW3797784.1 TIGR01244 family sulfur transferase [Sphingomonas sp. BN140010]